MLLPCPKCGCDRPVYEDILNDQPIKRCRSCHRRLAAAQVLPKELRSAGGLTWRERYRPVSIDGVSRSKHLPKDLRSGLTLIELVIVLAVAAIIGIVVTSMVHGAVFR